ncbi:hypothetical protein ABLE94_04780 [Gordonia sp. VNK1]|uniref:RCC1 domain-containing protein n=1 Tax=Gordonia oleivorans TaxID=3156618 RepID=UPI0032B404EA
MSCGIKGRALLCWGDNDYGAVGDGTTTDRHVPTPVSGLTEVTSVSVAPGAPMTCAVSKGQVYCWGQDIVTGDVRRTPVVVDGISNVSSVSAGLTSCAVRRAEVWCWGNNSYGNAGNGKIGGSVPDPTKVVGLDNVASVSTAVGSACAITRAQELYCWGLNANGQVGDGTQENRATPVKITGLRSVTSVSLSPQNTCAVAESTVYCWGFSTGQYPAGTEDEHLAPERVDGIEGARQVVSVGDSGCASVISGDVQCFGAFDTSSEPGPTELSGLDHVTQLLGAATMCAISAGQLYCWGLNNSGQLGNGTTTASLNQPVRVRDPE